MFACRVCKTRNWEAVLSLGFTPLANNYIRMNDLKKEEIYYPLNVVFCSVCGLVSLDTVIPAPVLYDYYYYLSSESRTILRHNEWFARYFTERYGLGPGDLVVEIGSNTGTQLRFLKNLGSRILGVEPAENIASLANEAGIETLNRYFTKGAAEQIVRTHGRSRCIVARHVFAHIDDVDEVVRAVDTLLTDDGVFAIEVPYLVDLVEGNQFDTIYHEHLSYFSIGTLDDLMGRHGLRIADVEHVGIHGGTVIVLVERAHQRPAGERARALIDEERARGVNRVDYLQAFAKRTEQIKLELVSMVHELKRRGKRLAGYGAPAKGNTMLNYCGINSSYLDYVRDNTPTKQGLYLPGTHIRIRSDEYAAANPPDYYLLLAWNYVDEILDKEKEFLDAGGGFIVPIPAPRIVER